MRSVSRLMAALALGALIALTLSTPGIEAGRDDTRCKQACRTTKNECDAECLFQCGRAFPENFERRNACISRCRAECARQERECRLGCKVDRPPVTPEKP